jgi:hypothetical protein
LAILVCAPAVAGAQERLNGRDEVVRVTQEYREVLSAYQPGSVYEGALEQIIVQLEALSPEEVELYEQVFGSLADRARENLKILKVVLHNRDIAIHSQMTSTGFPDADLSTIDVPGLIDIAWNELPKIQDLWNWILSGDLGSVPDIPFVAESAIPLYCPGDLDSDGLPDREPPEALLAMQAGLQIMELRWQIAGRICDQDLGLVAVAVLGGGIQGNLSVVCILEDILFFIPKDLFENVMACEAYYDGQELEASYLRLGHLHEDLEDHESSLDGHDGDIKALIAQLQAVQGQHGEMLEAILANQEEIIELLKTPQGQRDGWNGKGK